MYDDTKEMLEDLYCRRDPWNYSHRNRHLVTVGIAQHVWRGGFLAELGCGEGILLECLRDHLSPHPITILGIERAGAAVLRARDRLGFGVSVLGGDLETDEWRSVNGFDMIVVSDVTPYLGQAAGVLYPRAFQRVKVGGHLVMTTWTDGHPFGTNFPEELPGGRFVERASWAGEVMNSKGELYESTAEYLVARRES